MPAKSRFTVFGLATLTALGVAATASAHAHVSPPVALAQNGQVFTLAVPTEKSGATTTSIELAVPKGFAIDSFLPTAGWKRAVQQTGSGDSAVITKVTWTNGAVPTGEDAAFSFLAQTNATGDYAFSVRQTYSDGSVVDWSGPESSDTPAPHVQSVSSLGAGGSSTLGIVAVVLAGIALLVTLVGLIARGNRTLT